MVSVEHDMGDWARDTTLDPEAPASSKDARGATPTLAITILFHSDLSRVGDQHRVTHEGSSTESPATALGRASPAFASDTGLAPRPIDDPCVSKNQLSIRWSAAGIHVASAADARRPIELFDREGRALGGATGGVFPSGSIIAVGDRLLLHARIAGPRPTAAPRLLGVSDEVESVRRRIAEIASSSGAVLVTGETGAGKDVVATSIHEESARRAGPFVPLNCAALPEHLAESELFGHLRGAFSGAAHAKDGLFRAAHQGTLFLDEIGDLPLPVQAKLLRALETGRVRAVGSEREIDVAVRVVAATNRDLESDVLAGRFRADLLARLAGFVIDVPPLRVRSEDKLVLFFKLFGRHLLGERGVHPVWRGATEKPPPIPMSFAMELLRCSFPRNVRELSHLAHEAATLTGGSPTFVPPKLRAAPSPSPTSTPAAQEPLSEDTLVRLLQKHDYVQRRVAAELCIPYATLDRRLRELGIARAVDLERGAIDAARTAHGDDLEAMARHLGVSARGLKLRMGQLGM